MKARVVLPCCLSPGLLVGHVADAMLPPARLQLTDSVVEALESGPPSSREAALLLVQAVAPALARNVSAILPLLLSIAADPSKEVRARRQHGTVRSA